MVTATVMLILTVAILSFSTAEYLNSSTTYKKSQAVNLAEAGVDYTIKQLTDNPNYTGTGASPISLGDGEFETTVSGSGSSRAITGTAYIPNKANYKQKKVVKLSLTTTSDSISFHYAVQIGNDGITMYSNSVINGNAYSNGNITGSGNSEIKGDAYAVGTISSPKPTVNPPYAKYPGSAPSVMPTLDYDYWKEQANINNDPYTGTYQVTNSCPVTKPTLGPKKIIGNFTMNSNSCLEITGPIHITGNFEMNSNTGLFLDDDFGSSGTVIIVDGTIKMNSNSYIHTTDSTPKGYILLATTNSSTSAVELNSNANEGIIYALEGTIQFNSNAHANSVVGKKFVLNSNATLDYDEGLADASFTTGPGGSWTIQKGTWQEL